ncbi:dipeptidase [Amphibacillus sediminis]|uniref:dipeptidase n=1 Tax=Amphibacillus sediminis TaxID=360185 RepID=UPI0008378E0F|nr:membrane dipeptidase [Amphibacillus sediminis]
MLIDAHCDYLVQLWQQEQGIAVADPCQFNLEKWRQSPVRIQAFAIFVPDHVAQEDQFDVALKMIELFYQKIIAPNPDIVPIKTRADLDNLPMDKRGAILTLEGCHPIGYDLNKLKRLIDYGVRIVGLTWNNSNAVADSIDQANGRGLSPFGIEVVRLLNEEQIWTDVSHLSIKGFYDVIEHAAHVLASHSNAFSICQHRRNLDDQQIAAMIRRDGWIGLTFVPYFTKSDPPVRIPDLVRHIDHFLDLGAENQLGFGSDFAGFTSTIEGLADVTEYPNLLEQLNNIYSPDLIEKISGINFQKKFPRI